jgi:7-cyano-7-deazaguanine synthase in queuosine biosynthesis
MSPEMDKKRMHTVGNRKNRTLVMFSGGIDSTAALWHVLHNPDVYGEVLVHHIHIKNLEARWRAEAIAVKNVLDYLKEHVQTPFSYSESTIAVPHFGNKFMYDVEVIGFVTGYMTSRDPSITKVVIAATATDFELGVDGSVIRGKRMHNAYHPDEDDHSLRIKEYPHRDLTKEEVYKSVPAELAALTWSCRTPHYADGKPIECGRCKTCKIELKNIERPNAPGRRNYE